MFWKIRKEVRNLGVVQTDPAEYIRRYGPTLIRSDQLPDIAHQYANVSGLQLACNHQPNEIPILEGDVHALRLVDLDQLGLNRLKSTVSFIQQPTATYYPTHVQNYSPQLNNNGPAFNMSSTAAAAVAAANAAVANSSTGVANVADASSIILGSGSGGGLSAEEELYLSSYTAEHQQNNHTSTVAQSQESVVTTQSLLNTLSS